MWSVIPSLEPILQALWIVFTEPSLRTHCDIFLGWIMCLGRRTEHAVFQTTRADSPAPHNQRHPFDRHYNFFSRSSWSVKRLAWRVAVMAVQAFHPSGKVHLIIDDTLLHKRGRRVYALGWFRDAVASTAQRVATASGNHWVVLGLAIFVPKTDVVLCLPISARLHLPGNRQASEAALAREMLLEALAMFPERELVLLADGAYSAEKLLKRLPPRVTYVGRMRGDAEIYDPEPAPRGEGRRGRKPSKGPRLPSPRQAARLADAGGGTGRWVWQSVQVTIYGVERTLQVLSYRAVWPKVLGLRPIQVVVVRDPAGKLRDTCLFTTDLSASVEWVVRAFSWRWSIEVAFKGSKQVMQIEAPQHWCQKSVERLAPWVWLMQSVVTLWHLTEGRHLPEAAEVRKQMGLWDSEYSLRNMVRVLRRATLRQTIRSMSSNSRDMAQLIKDLENYVSLAA
jgi:hypothetical protein